MKIRIFIFLLMTLSASTVNAQIVKSTYTIVPVELTKEEIAIIYIKSLSPDSLTAIKLARQTTYYTYMEDTLIKKQAILEIQEERKGKRPGYIYPSQIKAKEEKIKADTVLAKEIP